MTEPNVVEELAAHLFSEERDADFETATIDEYEEFTERAAELLEFLGKFVEPEYRYKIDPADAWFVSDDRRAAQHQRDFYDRPTEHRFVTPWVRLPKS